jgi:hypothetical protein
VKTRLNSALTHRIKTGNPEKFPNRALLWLTNRPKACTIYATK